MHALSCEYMKRAAYLDELYDSVKKVSGLSVESILGLFAAGYTFKPPEKQKTMEDIAKELDTLMGPRK